MDFSKEYTWRSWGIAFIHPRGISLIPLLYIIHVENPSDPRKECRKRDRDGKLKYQFTKSQRRYKNSYDGFFTSCASTNIRVHIFQSKDAAVQYYKKLDNFKSPYILRQRLVDSLAYALVITDPIPPMSIGDWIQKQNSQPVKDESRLIFRGILKSLKRLHENGRCHGNLWNGVYIDGQHAVLADYSDDIDLLVGMKKGLSHSHKLLRHVNDIIQSHGFKSFVRLYKQMPSVLGGLRFVSNYTLINFVSYVFYK